MTPSDRTTRAALIWTALIFGALFLSCVLAVKLSGAVLGGDAPVAQWLTGHRAAGWTAFLGAVSRVHGPLPIAAETALLAGWLAWRRSRAWALFTVVAVGGGMLLNTLVKLAMHRARPDVHSFLVHASFFSFPSGHTAGSCLFYGTACIVALQFERMRRWRLLLASAAVVMVLLVSVSRLYLGVHFLTDIAAALFESGMWLAACAAFRPAAGPDHSSATSR